MKKIILQYKIRSTVKKFQKIILKIFKFFKHHTTYICSNETDGWDLCFCRRSRNSPCCAVTIIIRKPSSSSVLVVVIIIVATNGIQTKVAIRVKFRQNILRHLYRHLHYKRGQGMKATQIKKSVTAKIGRWYKIRISRWGKILPQS